MRVGVLSLQGDFLEHLRTLERCNATPVSVKTPPDFDGLDALIIPGGESTTFTRLIERHGLEAPIRALAERDAPLLGTCAGLILMATRIDMGKPDQLALGLLDVTVARNAFGRQVDSFEADLDIAVLGERRFRGVFIRAPIITAAGAGVETLARVDSTLVGVQQGRRLGLSFHPELSGDLRMHKYFLGLAGAR